MVKFFQTLNEFVSYDEEVFPCELVVSSDLCDLCDLCEPLDLLLTPHLSTARLEPGSGAGRRREGNSPTHAEERSGERL